MRVTFVRGIEAVFFAVILALVAAVITMIVHATGLKSPEKPETLAEWDKRDLKALNEAKGAPQQIPAADLQTLGFEPSPTAGDVLPADTISFNDMASNLLNLLHNYYFLPGDKMLDGSVEYVDRETGYIKSGQKIFDQYSLGHVGKHVKYLLALAKYQKLYPTNVTFAEDYRKMDALVKEIFSNPPNFVYQIETFFDLLELNKITGEQRYLDYADILNGSGSWVKDAERYALLVQRKAPRTIKPQFLSYVLLLQYYAEHGNPLLAQAASSLYSGVIADTYAPNYKMFFTQGSSPQQGDIEATAIPMFHSIEQAIAVRDMVEYFEDTGNNAVFDAVKEVIGGLVSGQSELVDRTNGGFFTTYQEKSSRYLEDEKRVDSNLMMYSGLTWYLKHDKSIRDIMLILNDHITERVYDANYNGFYSHYDFDWTPKAVDGVYELSLSDAILGAQIYLDEEEVLREIRAGGS